MAKSDRDKLRDAIADSFIVQGEIEYLSGEISRISQGVEKDRKEIERLNNVQLRIEEAESTLIELRNKLTDKNKEMEGLTKYIQANHASLPYTKSGNKQISI